MEDKIPGEFPFSNSNLITIYILFFEIIKNFTIHFEFLIRIYILLMGLQYY